MAKVFLIVTALGVAVWVIGALWHALRYRWCWRMACWWPVFRFWYKGPQ